MSYKTKRYMKHIDESLYAILDYTREANVLFNRMVKELSDIKRDGIVVTKKVVSHDEDLDADPVTGMLEKSPRSKTLEAIDTIQNYIEMDFSATRSGFKGLIQELEELRMHMNKFSNDHGEGVE